MSRKYALLKNNVVVDIQVLEDEQLYDVTKNNEMVIDIENESPQPLIGYVLTGNKLQLPGNESDRELFEINLAQKKTEFGIALSRNAIDRIGARNKILNKSGPQVVTLLNQLIGIKMLLETGALGTARYNCSQLKLVYNEYADIFDLVVNEVNSFENTFGL